MHYIADSVAGEHYGGGLEEHFEDNLDMNPGEPGLPAETNFEQGLRGGHGAQVKPPRCAVI